MKRILMLGVASLLIHSVAMAQHSDIRFSYEADVIVLREGIPGNTDGLQIFEGNFPKSGLSERFTENPGFLAEIENGDVLLPGDTINLEVYDSQGFGSFLTYYDPDADAMVPTDATLTIEDNNGTMSSDLVISNMMISGDNPQLIQNASSSGEVHAHIDFSLSAEAECGAYGFLFRLSSSNPMIADSQPIWLVFNFGMSPTEFDDFAIPAFVGKSVLLGDVNLDGEVNLLDVTPFVELLSGGGYSPEADANEDGALDLLDVGPFIALLSP